MASKEDIISYVMKTPENTNPAILGDMLDSMGGIETSVIFEDDITLIYRKGSYNPDSATIDPNYYFTSSPFTEIGFIIITFDNFKILSAVNGGTSSDPHFSFNIDVRDYYTNDDTSLTLVVSVFYDPKEEKSVLQVGLTSDNSNDLALNEYCQIPHHLKIEFFKI